MLLCDLLNFNLILKVPNWILKLFTNFRKHWTKLICIISPHVCNFREHKPKFETKKHNQNLFLICFDWNLELKQFFLFLRISGKGNAIAMTLASMHVKLWLSFNLNTKGKKNKISVQISFIYSVKFIDYIFLMK